MRPGSHTDSLSGPLWNSNWKSCVANPLILPSGRKKNTLEPFTAVFAEHNIQKYFHRTVWGNWGFMHLIIREVKTPEYLTNRPLSVHDVEHFISLRLRPNMRKGCGLKLHIMLRRILGKCTVIRDTFSKLVSRCLQFVYNLVSTSHFLLKPQKCKSKVFINGTIL